jgi:DNA repair protein RadD
VLRDFQSKLKVEIYEAWAQGARDVMGVMATGGGKTVLFCDIIAEQAVPTCSIAHRQELVGQAALQLNREQVPHGIIAPDAIQRQIVTLEQEMHGRSFFSPRADVRVAGVDTLVGIDPRDPWLKRVSLIVQDEGHHTLKENKWGRAHALFPQARGLLMTAHAIRSDGRGLGRQADGLADKLVIGPCARELMSRGFLCDYRLIAPPSDIHVEDIDVGESGEYNQKQVRAAVHSSKTIVGDVVKHYLKFAAGKLGITFAVDIEAATELAAKYRSEGIPAEIITAKTPLFVRGQLMRQFRARQILQLVSVDVLGEGVDVPAVEVVSMARPTASFQLYSQQFGRALRLMLTDQQNATWNDRTDTQRLAEIAASVKPKAIIIDHVENYVRHGLPDVERKYSLDRAPRRSRKEKSDEIPLRYCINEDCLEPYPAVLSKCPNCGTPKPPPMRRGTPEEVDGNCFELDPEVLHAMRVEQAKVDGPARIPPGAADIVMRSIHKNHNMRRDAQHELRKAMALWAGWQQSLGRDGPEVQRTFFFKYGRDVMSAQVLGAEEADELRARIEADLAVNNIVEARVVHERRLLADGTWINNTRTEPAT